MANFRHFRKLAMQNNPDLRGKIASDEKIIANLMIASRFNKEWTQEELARKVGVSLDEIIDIESGISTVSSKTKEMVMQLLDITPDDVHSVLSRYRFNSEDAASEASDIQLTLHY